MNDDHVSLMRRSMVPRGSFMRSAKEKSTPGLVHSWPDPSCLGTQTTKLLFEFLRVCVVKHELLFIFANISRACLETERAHEFRI